MASTQLGFLLPIFGLNALAKNCPVLVLSTQWMVYYQSVPGGMAGVQ